MAETRKLAAILAADVAGYSKLAGSDEERTLARLRALRSNLFDPTIALHHGRVVKRTGDGVLIEFRSVVDAVRCAIEVQNGMVERNASAPRQTIDRRVAVSEHERRPRAGLFLRRHGRGHHYRPHAHQMAFRHRAEFDFHLHGDWGRAFGTMPSGSDTQAIIDRSRIQAA